jgi:hypothetical protein
MFSLNPQEGSGVLPYSLSLAWIRLAVESD